MQLDRTFALLFITEYNWAEFASWYKLVTNYGFKNCICKLKFLEIWSKCAYWTRYLWLSTPICCDKMFPCIFISIYLLFVQSFQILSSKREKKFQKDVINKICFEYDNIWKWINERCWKELFNCKYLISFDILSVTTRCFI